MEQRIAGKKLNPLPPGDEPIVALSTAHYAATARRAVVVSIGRPTIEETATGEMVASTVMSLDFAEWFAQRLLTIIEHLKNGTDPAL